MCEPHQCFQNYGIFLRRFDNIFHMFRCISKTCNQNKKGSLNQTREGNMLLDLLISAQKYLKIKTQEKEKIMFKPHQKGRKQGRKGHIKRVPQSQKILRTLIFLIILVPCTLTGVHLCSWGSPNLPKHSNQLRSLDRGSRQRLCWHNRLSTKYLCLRDQLGIKSQNNILLK